MYFIQLVCMKVFVTVSWCCRNQLAGTMSGGGEKDGVGESSSIGSAGSLAKRNQGELSWESDGKWREFSSFTKCVCQVGSCLFK